MRKILAIFILIIIAFAAIGLYSYFFPKKEELDGTVVPEEMEEVFTDLKVPWEFRFLPDGRVLVTERPGNLIIFSDEGKTEIKVEGVVSRGEGGLLGLAVHPDFETNGYIYLYKTTASGNMVERYKLTPNSQLSERQIILENIPSSINHDGGRIAFGPDNFLYITTGDAGNDNLAQDKNSLAGKILRVKDNGEVPEDNPFGNQVYSYGHRNPEGLAWDDEDQLWATEHGSSAHDELNKIEKGKNYGWPVIKGDEKKEGMEAPVLESGSETWAPAGLAFSEGRLIFAGLRGKALFVVDKTSPEKIEKTLFDDKLGRLRAVNEKDGEIYFSTSNNDGRGIPATKDDKIIKIKKGFLSKLGRF